MATIRLKKLIIDVLKRKEFALITNRVSVVVGAWFSVMGKEKYGNKKM